jgi:hypothetical protein
MTDLVSFSALARVVNVVPVERRQLKGAFGFSPLKLNLRRDKEGAEFMRGGSNGRLMSDLMRWIPNIFLKY